MKKISVSLLLSLWSILAVFSQEAVNAPRLARPVYFDISPPLRDMVPEVPAQYDGSWKDGVVWNYFDPQTDLINQAGQPGWKDLSIQTTDGDLPSDTTIQNFEGLPNVSGYVPPDTHGEAGIDYFFQTVNCSYAIFNKSGAKILGPLANSSVWSGMPNNANSGDAIVVYDEQANRWLFSQFSLPNGSSTAPFYQMIAVSQTPDPTGSWYRYQYEFSSMPDYPKLSVWPDGYYMSTNNFGPAPSGWVGNGACAFDREAMLSGSPDALMIMFTLNPSGEGFISLLPSDCDGQFPEMGTPNYFTYVRTNGTQRLGIFEFHADWETPAASTFGNVTYLPVNSFNTLGWGSGIPQLGTDKMLDPLSDRLMYRLQYRKFSGYGSMVLNHTVSAGNGNSGIRWYELRNSGTGWSIHQQSTYAPGDGHSRWMASIAQDTSGTIAMGYSVSGSTIYPGIRYTGRMKNDPLNQMTLSEKVIIHGGGAQTGIWSGRCRWGDYSGISIDPASPTTFWYTTEYYGSTSSSSWQTRIASFTFANVFSSAASATPALLCTSSNDSVQLKAYGYGGSGSYTYTWSSLPAGFSSQVSNPKVKPDQNTKYVVAVSDGSLTRLDTVSVRVVEAPSASAGNDTIVCWYIAPIPLSASASNYSKVAWGTTGDGHFSNPASIDAEYFPGLKDKMNGGVDLKLLVVPSAPCVGNLTQTKHITLDPCTGTEEILSGEARISLFPNPAKDFVNISIEGIRNPVSVSVISPDGRQMYRTETGFNPENDNTLKVDISTWPSGIFLVQVNHNGTITSSRFIKQ